MPTPVRLELQVLPVQPAPPRRPVLVEQHWQAMPLPVGEGAPAGELLIVAQTRCLPLARALANALAEHQAQGRLIAMCGDRCTGCRRPNALGKTPIFAILFGSAEHQHVVREYVSALRGETKAPAATEVKSTGVEQRQDKTNDLLQSLLDSMKDQPKLNLTAGADF